MRSYDYIVVGTGSAGCVIANRLSAEPSARVLVLEAGGSDRRLSVRAPAAFPNQFKGRLDWCYFSEPEPALDGRRVFLPRGRVLGGCSSMNAMIYMRGNRADFDAWESEHGAEGWSYDSVLPYFRRSERNAEFRDTYHGNGGEMHVTFERWRSGVWPMFVESAAAVGIERNDDPNGARQEGSGSTQVTIHDGRRWNAAEGFLRPALGRPNVDLVTRALARRVVIEGGRATGVEYLHRGKPVVARAEREVIVSAGAYGSPHLLMLSGVGPADHLREVGVEPIVESPAVGSNLQEHPITYTTWSTTRTDTLADATKPRHLAEFLLRRRGKLTSNVAEAFAHVRTQPDLPSPDFQLLFAPAYFVDHGFAEHDGPALTIATSLIRPVSRGEVRLRSADARVAPAILNRMLSDPSEMDAMVAAVGLAREIAGTSPLASVVSGEIDPGPGVGDREAIESWIRATAQHTYHPACTCRIGPPGEGVVAPDLRVHGVEGLRVADASVMPRITSGNTHAPTTMIGERCADFALGRRPMGSGAEASRESA
jgi:choline dehydrogenase